MAVSVTIGTLTRCPACGTHVPTLPAAPSDPHRGQVSLNTVRVDSSDVELHMLTQCPAKRP